MTIQGRIVDANGAPIPNVTVHNTTSGAATMANGGGNYSIDVDPSDVVEFSSVGYTTRDVTAEDLNFFQGEVVMQINTVDMAGVTITAKAKPSMLATIFLIVVVTLLVIGAAKMAKVSLTYA